MIALLFLFLFSVGYLRLGAVRAHFHKQKLLENLGQLLHVVEQDPALARGAIFKYYGAFITELSLMSGSPGSVWVLYMYFSDPGDTIEVLHAKMKKELRDSTFEMKWIVQDIDRNILGVFRGGSMLWATFLFFRRLQTGQHSQNEYSHWLRRHWISIP